MSSPLGGFYVNAYNRDKKTEHEQNTQARFNVKIAVFCDDKLIIDGDVGLIDGHQDQWQNRHCRLDLTATQKDDLCQFHCRFIGKGQYADASLNGEQLLNVELNEELSCQIAANERLKLTVTISRELQQS